MAKDTIGSMTAVIRATASQFTKDINQVKQQIAGLKRTVATSTPPNQGVFDTFKNTAAMTAGILGIAGAANTASRAIRGLFTSSRDFSRGMAESTAILSGVTTEIRAEMEQTARQVGFNTKFSAAEAAKAYFFLASAGFDAQQSIGAMPVVAKFAQAGMFDLSLATDLLTDAQSALGMVVKDSGQNMANMTRLADVLVKANSLANASVEQFSTALTTKAGPSMRSFSQEFEAGVAVLAAFADQGIKAEEAGTQYSIVLRDMTTKSLQNADAFREAGIAVFDSAGKVRSLVDVLADMEKALEPLSDMAKKQLLLDLGFSDRSVGSLLALLGTSDKIRRYEEELRKAGGTMEQVATANIPPLDQALNKLSGAFDNIATTTVTPVLEAFAATVNIVADALASSETSFAEVVIKMGAFGIAAGATLILLPKLVRAFGAVVKSLKSLAQGQALVTALSNPKGWLVLLGSAAAGAAAVYGLDLAFAGLEDQTESALAAATEAAKVNTEVAKSVDAVADATKDAAEAQKELDKLMERGKQVTEQLRTPMEVYNDTIDDLAKLLDVAAINWDTYVRGVHKAADAFKDATEEKKKFDRFQETRSVAAVARGTTAGFSAVQAATRLQADMQRRQIEMEKESLVEEKKQTVHLSRIEAALLRGREVEAKLDL